MPVWELTGYNTDPRYQTDVRYRGYTASPTFAEAFGKVPKIQFTDSGHGIYFMAWPHKVGSPKKPRRSELRDYVRDHVPTDMKWRV